MPAGTVNTITSLLLLVVAVLLQHHLPDLLDLDPVQVHRDRLSLYAQVQLEQVADVVEQPVVDGLGDGHALVGVELEGTLQEVVDFWGDEAEELGEGLALPHSERLDVVACSFIADEVDVSRCADGAEDDGAEWGKGYSWSQTEWGKSLIFLQFMSDDLGGERGQHALPGKSGLRQVKTLVMVISSPRMQPTDQMSMALLYFLQRRMSSGARYHLVATWAVRLTAGFSTFSCFSSSSFFISLTTSSSFSTYSSTARASPKSHSFTWFRSSVMSMFSGLRSLWRTWDCWQQLSPSRIWKMISLILRQSKRVLDLKSFLASVGMQSRIRESSLPFSSSMTISRRLMMFGCFSFRSNKISLRMRSDSYLFSRKFLIFLMATRSPVWMLMAEKTMEDTPYPIFFYSWYLPAITFSPASFFSRSCFYRSRAALRSRGFKWFISKILMPRQAPVKINGRIRGDGGERAVGVDG